MPEQHQPLPRGSLRELLETQSGVISRQQALDCGLAAHDIRRKLRRREWARIHDGVYVDHTGRPDWIQRAWAAVLLTWPSALYGRSALRAADAPGHSGHDDGPIHVAIDRDRAAARRAGVVLHRLGAYDAKVQASFSPPRQRVEEAVLDVAADARSDLDAIATLADAVRSRLTTARRIRAALDGRSRVTRRRLMAGVLDDIADGTCSVLEHGYLAGVERAHGLPTANRQVRDSARGTLYRDVTYDDHALIVELDGALFHTSMKARARDLDRDLDAAIDRRLTVRLGWGQVFDTACQTAQRVATLLRQRGWEGAMRPCARCRTEDSGRSAPPGDLDPPLSA